MSDIERRMAEWRKNLWGAGPCPDSSRENFRLTDAERAAVQWAAAREPEPNGRWTKAQEKTWNKRAATLRGLRARLRGAR